MAFDGTEGFIALDEDLVAGNEPLDTFVDNAVRSNLLELGLLGDRASWTPRTHDADDQDQKTGVRPYASAARSSVMNVPYLVQPGDLKTSIVVHNRVDDEHGENTGLVGYLSLDQVVESGRFSITRTAGFTPQWQTFKRELELLAPAPRDLITDLRFEIRSDVASSDIDTTVEVFDVLFGGSFVSDPGGADTVLEQDLGPHPSSGDRHLMAFENEDSGDLFDILWASQTESSAYVRPETISIGGVNNESNNSRTRPLSYLQVRSIEIQQTYDAASYLRPQSRYKPHASVDGRDEIAHPLAIDRAYQRKRLLWVGPRGNRDAAEGVWTTGYGPKFGRAIGSSTPQELIRATIKPTTKAPKIWLLSNILPSYVLSVLGTTRSSIFTVEDLERAVGRVGLTFDLAITRFEDGAAAPVAVESSSEDLTLDFWPQIVTPLSPALLAEALISGGFTQGAFKEGQLFPEDYGLLQRVWLEIELPDHDPAVSLDPYNVVLSVSVDSMANFEPDVSEDLSAHDEDDLVITDTGSTIWEVPQ